MIICPNCKQELDLNKDKLSTCDNYCIRFKNWDEETRNLFLMDRHFHIFCRCGSESIRYEI